MSTSATLILLMAASNLKLALNSVPERVAVVGVAVVPAAPESPAAGVGAAVAPARRRQRRTRLAPGPG